MHLSAATVRSERALINKSLYWAAFESAEEADFLCAILNSAVTTEMVRPYMSYGKDERHIDKHIWEVPIPAFDPDDRQHRELVSLGREVAALVSNLELDLTVQFPTLRARIRRTIETSPVGVRISEIVYELLS